MLSTLFNPNQNRLGGPYPEEVFIIKNTVNRKEINGGFKCDKNFA